MKDNLRLKFLNQRLDSRCIGDIASTISDSILKIDGWVTAENEDLPTM